MSTPQLTVCFSQVYPKWAPTNIRQIRLTALHILDPYLYTYLPTLFVIYQYLYIYLCIYIPMYLCTCTITPTGLYPTGTHCICFCVICMSFIHPCRPPRPYSLLLHLLMCIRLPYNSSIPPHTPIPIPPLYYVIFSLLLIR